MGSPKAELTWRIHTLTKIWHRKKHTICQKHQVYSLATQELVGNLEWRATLQRNLNRGLRNWTAELLKAVEQRYDVCMDVFKICF